MSKQVANTLLTLLNVTGVQPRYWRGHHYTNATLDEVRDIYMDFQYTIDPTTMFGSFYDMGADAQPEDSYNRRWHGTMFDWGYIALLKEPRDEAKGLVEIGLIDESSDKVDKSDYHWMICYPVKFNGDLDDTREVKIYREDVHPEIDLQALSTLTFLQLFVLIGTVKLNIYLNDDRLKLDIYENEE